MSFGVMILLDHLNILKPESQLSQGCGPEGPLREL